MYIINVYIDVGYMYKYVQGRSKYTYIIYHCLDVLTTQYQQQGSLASVVCLCAKKNDILSQSDINRAHKCTAVSVDSQLGGLNFPCFDMRHDRGIHGF